MKPADFIQFKRLSYIDGIIKYSNNIKASFDKIYLEYINTLDRDEQPQSREVFTAALEEIEQSSQKEFIYPSVDTPDDLVQQAIEYNKFYIGPKGERITQDGHNATLEDLETAVLHHSNHYRADSKGIDGKFKREVWGPQEMRTALNYALRQREISTRNGLRNDLDYDPTLAGFTDQVIDYLFKRYAVSGDPHLAREVFKQWMWQTKRYIHGMHVPAPIMVNIMGAKQETGKTLLVKHFAEPLKDFFSYATLAQMVDGRESQKWSGNYIVLLDELSLGHITPAEMGQATTTLKALLTADEITHRVMRTTKHNTSARTFSPIATSNETITSVIYDPTGMRRFFEIVFNCDRDQTRINELLELSTAQVWRGIDHNSEKGYVYPGTDTYLKMLSVQDTYKKLDPIDWALQYVDYGQIPAKVADIPDYYKALMEAENINNVEVPEGLELVTVMELRKRHCDWLKDEMGSDMATYVPHGERYMNALAGRGYAVVNFGVQQQRIICHKEISKQEGPKGI